MVGRAPGARHPAPRRDRRAAPGRQRRRRARRPSVRQPFRGGRVRDRRGRRRVRAPGVAAVPPILHLPSTMILQDTAAKITDIQLGGAFGFGLLIGWYVYYINRY